ncbi:MAG: M20/M25/M40 family metallo-hydrolase [Deltaproteobacteria bacterium]|nr:M20/M25/M40 family metallo-hydrolase [Deltaproteobacteria bacterium]
MHLNSGFNRPVFALLPLLLSIAFTLPAGAYVLVDSDFRYGLGVWTDTSGDDFDWDRISGSTPSANTGPASDHTTGTESYIYTEATGNFNSTAILEGPCIDLTGRSAASWSFWHHMWGGDMGTLYAEAADSCADTPTTWTPVSTIIGDQGNSWQQVNIDLASRLGTQFKIRFRGVTGSGLQSDMAIDDVLVDATGGSPPAPEAVVGELDINNFKAHVEYLSSSTNAIGGSRHWSQPGNAAALTYIENELVSYGYTVERHTYTFSSQQRDNIYATKIGTVHPDKMFIVSAHMDSFNTQSSGSVFAPGANDDGSGTALVLEAARVFGDASVSTEYSVRFILWNNEETGLNGSAAYVSDKAGDQGVESPPGSGLYPEPTWLLIAQHDMMMWDHGLPSQSTQIAAADVDIEYQASSSFPAESLVFADYFEGANEVYAPAYPSEVSNDMNWTDSKSFQNHCPAISLRENRRIAEIGNGADPNWHKNSDVYSTYSEADFLLGFTALQTTVGAIASLSGASVVGATPVPSGSPITDGLIGLMIIGPAVVSLTRGRLGRA